MPVCTHPSVPKQTRSPHPCSCPIPTPAPPFINGIKIKVVYSATPEKAAASRCASFKKKTPLPAGKGFGQGDVLPPCPAPSPPLVRPPLRLHPRGMNQPEKKKKKQQSFAPGKFTTTVVMSFNPPAWTSAPRALPSSSSLAVDGRASLTGN